MLPKSWWKKGRQGTNYYKLKILENKFLLPFDIYILKFPSGSHIQKHVDPVEDGRRHFRLNVVLKPAPEGGVFRKHGDCPHFHIFGPFEFFRPDICPHSMTQVQGGSKYYLSIGWLWGRDK